MKIRLIQAGTVSPLYSQAIYHGIAEQITAKDEPVLVILQPKERYISIGLHQSYIGDVNVAYCEKHNIDVIRRNVGGGTVLLDVNQLFFQFVFPKAKAPNQPKKLYQFLLNPVLQTYHYFGIPAVTKSMNDIQVCDKKIGGTGAATINNATVLVGSFLFDFDYPTMANCINSPSDNFRVTFEGLLEQNMTTIIKQVSTQPGVNELTDIFIQNVEKLLGVEIENAELTLRENESIDKAMSELSADEWLKFEGKKLVTNGIKIAAGVYLLEDKIEFCANPLIIRVKVEHSNLHTIWLESDVSKIKASLIFVTNNINTAKPNIEEKTLLDIITTSTSHFNTIDSTEANKLAKAICELCVFSEY